MAWPLRLFFCIAILVNCSYCSSQQGITRIEYHAASRALRHQIIITPDSVTHIEEDFRRSGSPVVVRRKLTGDQWQRLLDALQGVKPESIAAMDAPTDKRTYDAASHGSIIITQEASSFTHGFDDTDPHQKLKPLMQAILELR